MKVLSLLLAFMLFAACEDDASQSNNNITISFDINSGTGTAPAKQTVLSEEEIILPDSTGFSRTGYEFGGWFVKDPYKEYKAEAPFKSSKDITVYALWHQFFTVTFNANGASGLAPSSLIVVSGTKIELPKQGQMSKEKHSFNGWSLSSTGTGTIYPPGTSYEVKNNASFFGVWETKYTVLFDLNSGIGQAPVMQTVSLNSNITLPAQGNNFSKHGYAFDGWLIGSTVYKAGASYKVTGDITCKAVWVELVTVTFDINDATGTAPSPVTVKSGTAIQLPDASGMAAKNKYHTLRGWNLNTSGTSSNYTAGSSFTVSKNTTLYANWGLYELGDTGPGGGLIFFFSREGFIMADTGEPAHFLEAAPNDITARAWGSPSYIAADILNTGTALGTGRKNTALIKELDYNAPAAKACFQYYGGELTDWFLPSKDELHHLYLNKASVGNIAGTNYWTSSQESSARAMCQLLSNGSQSNGLKTASYAVRPIRAF